MGFLVTAARAASYALEGRPPADHDFWYGPGWLSAAGLETQTEDTALKVSALWRALFILSNAGVASLPCVTYQRQADGGRKRAPGMPMYDILHDTPNTWMTAPEYWDFVVRALVLRGNACSLIVPGKRGAVDQLIPLHPDRLKIVELPNNAIGYRYRMGNGQPEVAYTQDEVWHVRVFGSGGRIGRSLLTYAAEDVGHALAMSRFGKRQFDKAPMLSGVLEVPGSLDDEAFARTRQSFAAAHGGPDNWHSVAVLEQGTKWSAMGMTNHDAQFLESKEFSIRDIARWTGVKAYLLESEKVPPYSSIEAFQTEHVTYAIRPWCYAIEQGIARDLILQPGIYFAEFLMDALLRGDPYKRAQTLEIQRRNGVINANEWRQLENRNARTDPDAESYWGQPNLARGKSAENANRNDNGEDDDAGKPDNSRALAIARAAAGRVVRKESAALVKAAAKYAADPSGFAAFVGGFYAEHAAFVSEAMGMTPDESQRYCTEQRGRVERDGVAGVEAWAATVPESLAQTALMGDRT